MKVFVIGLVSIFFVAVFAILMGYVNIAWWIANLGTFLWVMGVAFWVALFNSRTRWPGESFMQRLGSIISFRSD